MRKFGKIAFWTLVAALLPLTASAEEAASAASNLGPALGAGIARNPGAAGAMFVPYILGMVLIESIAIYGLLIAFQLLP